MLVLPTSSTTALMSSGLRDDFDEVQYVANYKDLQDAFGTDYEAATRHYITNGYHEGRTDEPLGDTPLQVGGLGRGRGECGGAGFSALNTSGLRRQ